MNSPRNRWLRAGLLVLPLLALSACGGTEPVESNACQGLVAGDLVITEVMSDPNGQDTGQEYFEIYNASTKGIPLSGITLFVAKLDGSGKKQHVVKAEKLNLPPGSYAAVGDFRDSQLPAHLVYSYQDALGAIGNESGRVGVACGKTVIDEVTWEKGTKSGRARTLDGALSPDSAVNDISTNFCDAATEFAEGAFGSPGAPNASCGAVATGCLDLQTGDRPLQAPQEGDLVITEIMANPSGTDGDKEWIEIFARTDVDLNGLELSLGNNKTVLSSTECLHLPARSYAVLARNPDATLNGGLVTSVMGVFKFDLTNAGGTVNLKSGDVLIDSATYGTAQDGVSWQLDPTKLDAASNDDAANFCASPATWQVSGAPSVDKGSPGDENAACAGAVLPGTCMDAVSGMSRPIVKPTAGQVIFTELLANPIGPEPAGEWIELYVSANVDLNGVELFYGDPAAGNVSSKQTFSSPECIRPGAGAYALVARSADPATNGGLPAGRIIAPLAFQLVNSGSRQLEVRLEGALLDALFFTPPVAEGLSLQVSSDKLSAEQNDLAGATCSVSATTTYGTAGNRGTPGATNEICAVP